MKKIIVTLMMLITAISPLFRGLFFDLEASAFLAVLALLSFIYFMIKLTNKEDIFFNKWLMIFGVLLIVAYGLAFISAVNPRVNTASFLLVLEYLVISIVLYDYFYAKKENFGTILMLTMIITGFINSIIGIEAITGAYKVLNNTIAFKRVGATFQYSNTAAIYFAIIIIFSLTIMYTLNKPLLRILLTGANCIILLAMLLTKSRGGYIVGFAAMILLMVIQSKEYKLKTVGSFSCAAIPALLLMQRISALTASEDALTLNKFLFFALLVAIFLATLFEGVIILISKVKKKVHFPEAISRIIPYVTVITIVLAVFLYRNQIFNLIPHNIIERFTRISLKDQAILERLTFDKDALKLISKNWLLGVGGGGWAVLYYSVQEFLYISRAVHNHYFEVFVESGILGFISFILIVLVSIYYMVSGLLRIKEAKDRIYIAGLFSGFMALIIHSSFDFNLSYVSLGFLFWAMVASSALYSKHVIKFKRCNFLLLLVICSSILLLLNGLYAAASYNANRGLKLKASYDYTAARLCYEEAIRLDPTNSEYSYELTKLYNYFAVSSAKEENKEIWKNAALSMAERTISLNPYLPENIRILIRSYYTSNRYFDGIEYAEKLIVRQPYNLINYDLLAQGYLEAGKHYLELGNVEGSTDFLEKCSEIKPPAGAAGISDLSAYIEEALTLLELNSN